MILVDRSTIANHSSRVFGTLRESFVAWPTMSSGFGASHRLCKIQASTRFCPGLVPKRLDKKMSASPRKFRSMADSAVMATGSRLGRTSPTRANGSSCLRPTTEQVSAFPRKFFAAGKCPKRKSEASGPSMVGLRGPHIRASACNCKNDSAWRFEPKRNQVGLGVKSLKKAPGESPGA